MKRFCYDFMVLTMAFALTLCVAALIEGSLPVLAVIASMLGLACGIHLAYRESVRLEQQANRAKRQRRAQAQRAKRERTTRPACAIHAAPIAPKTNTGLFVA